MPWVEWEYWLNFKDAERLRRVFAPLMAFHRWMRHERTWPDGSYRSCGLACGMDNQPRTAAGDSPWVDHSFTAWVDTTAQAVLSARLLVQMAEALGPAFAARPEVQECREEAARLAEYVNKFMWHPERATYVDRRLRPGAAATDLSTTRTVGAYWTLLAGIVPPERLGPFTAALDDPATFNRPVRVPSLVRAFPGQMYVASRTLSHMSCTPCTSSSVCAYLSHSRARAAGDATVQPADHPSYEATGGYWKGGVWPSTTYMCLRGLTAVDKCDIAADIAANYHAAVVKCYEKTGTLWENMCPEAPEPGDPAKPDFVGWGGLAPIAVLLEYVFGIRADVPRSEIVWDIRLLEGFGCMRYPFGRDGVLHLQVAPRERYDENPKVYVCSTVAVTLRLQWGKKALAEGGTAVDRAGVPAGPIHERVIALKPNMTVDESAAEPVWTPSHRLQRLRIDADRPMMSPRASKPVDLNAPVP